MLEAIQDLEGLPEAPWNATFVVVRSYTKHRTAPLSLCHARLCCPHATQRQHRALVGGANLVMARVLSWHAWYLNWGNSGGQRASHALLYSAVLHAHR